MSRSDITGSAFSFRVSLWSGTDIFGASGGRSACPDERTWGHPFDPRTRFLGRRRGARLSLSAVTDAPTADRAAGLRLRPSSQPHRRVPATAEVGVEAQEDGHANVLVVLVDLDVVEAVYDPVKELDSERPIIRLDIYPIPPDRAEVSTRRVRNRSTSSGRPQKKSFRLALGNSSHAPIIYQSPVQAAARPLDPPTTFHIDGTPYHDRARRMGSWPPGVWQSLPAGSDILRRRCRISASQF